MDLIRDSKRTVLNAIGVALTVIGLIPIPDSLARWNGAIGSVVDASVRAPIPSIAIALGLGFLVIVNGPALRRIFSRSYTRDEIAVLSRVLGGGRRMKELARMEGTFRPV